MAQVNDNYFLLGGNYLFAEIKRRVNAYMESAPDADLIRLGIGDVTLPLAPAVIEAMHRAVDEMGEVATFRGYGPEPGYDFLIDAIIRGEYASRGVEIDRSEVFVSDGSKCDVGNIQELFSPASVVAIGDPVYPVYLDSNVMAGRAGEPTHGKYSRIVYLPCTAENGFDPAPPSEHVDLIYLCSPNNPTGTALDRASLARWIEYARKENAVILYDSAYSFYIQNPDLPHSIYELPGAKETAIEFKSFSKTAGFTGTRCAFTVIPKELQRPDSGGVLRSLNAMWLRRQSTKFNGVSYIVQRGAEAVYSPEGQNQIRSQIAFYMENARLIRTGLSDAGFNVYGGENAPYIWLKIKNGLDSMTFLDKLINMCQVVGTPGVGFGPHGEGYFRLTAFGSRDKTLEALDRIRKQFK